MSIHQLPGTKVGLTSRLRADLPASVVVFFVALPLCLGIALASGAPLVGGIIAGVVGGIVVGFLSGSPLGVAGPAAGLAVIVLTAIEELGSYEVFLVAVMLAGLMQLILGLIKAGGIAYYFPSSVITGMLAGIGIIIFLKQIPHALGYDKDPEGDFSFSQLDGETTFSELTTAMNGLSLGPFIIAAISLFILISFQTNFVKKHKALSLLPGPLVAVVGGVILNVLFDGPLSLKADQLVKLPVVEGLSGARELFVFPDFGALASPAVYKVGAVMAIVASLETLLCVEATDKLDPAKGVTPTNRELLAQGVGNVVSGLLGGLPVTQVIVRSSANIQAGGRSKLSTIVHGVLLVVSVLFLSTLLNLIPLATLAAILLLVGYKLATPALFKRMYAGGPAQFIPFIVTILGIVFTDLLTGVGIGLAVAIVGLLIENFQLPFQVYHVPHVKGQQLRLVLAQHVSFLNKASVLKSLSSIENDTVVEIDATGSVYLHPDVTEIIEDFKISAQSRNIEVTVIGLDPEEKCSSEANAAFSILPTPQQTSEARQT